jgi:hypothetical protein
MDMLTTDSPTVEATPVPLAYSQITEVLRSVAPKHPALRRLHERLNTSLGAEAVITSYDRMHHRHNRS